MVQTKFEGKLPISEGDPCWETTAFPVYSWMGKGSTEFQLQMPKRLPVSRADWGSTPIFALAQRCFDLSPSARIAQRCDASA